MSGSTDEPQRDTGDGDRPARAPGERRAGGWKTTLLACCAIVLAGAAAIAVIFHTEPDATRGGARKETAMLVEVTAARAGTFRPTIVATGTVRPAREIVLRPRVGGAVLEHAQAFVPGGTVAAGETLLRLDRTDYRHTLRQRRNELDQARADLRLEQGRKTLAEEEIRLLDEELTGENRALVLRQPQIDSARARVESARTAVAQARLQLERTTIEAPFDAHVLTREVDIGSQVAAGDALGRLVGTDTYWVETTIPVSRLRWLAFPDDGAGAAEVRIRDRGAWPPGVHRTGRLYKRIGTLDDSTRMARVLVAVDDPLAQGAGAPDRPPLMLGAYVQTRIEARPVTDVVRVEREHVRQDDTVWVMQDGVLEIRDVGIVLRDSTYAYVREGLQAGDRIVTSNLATVEDGAPLRLEASERGAGGAAAGGARPAGTRAVTGSGSP